MGEVHQIAQWQARRAAKSDVPIGAPPFLLEEPCPGCGAARVAAMVWRSAAAGARPVPFPRIEPHFLCRDGQVVWQEITEAPIPISDWSRILGRFQEAEGRGA